VLKPHLQQDLLAQITCKKVQAYNTAHNSCYQSSDGSEGIEGQETQVVVVVAVPRSLLGQERK
jgi:hypothetical protein